MAQRVSIVRGSTDGTTRIDYSTRSKLSSPLHMPHFLVLTLLAPHRGVSTGQTWESPEFLQVSAACFAQCKGYVGFHLGHTYEL